ncbi:MAG: DsbE family thiol:disulfide interchange protein [Sneathiellaceae bacterium]
MADAVGTVARQRRDRMALRFLLPAAVFALVAAALAWGLDRDPRALPSARIGEPVPEFSLPPVQGRALGLSSAHLEGQVSLVNVFASWCIPCRAEHPILMRLANGGTVPVFGLNYKDKPAEAAAFLDRLGDPYARTGADLDGRVAIDWGVYGVPETYIVAPDGRIAYRHAGPLTQDLVFKQIFPLLSRLRAEPKE